MDNKELKCIGCKCHLPKENMVDGKSTWFGKYLNEKMIDFICRACYDAGIRFKSK